MIIENVKPIGEYHLHILEVKPYDPTVVLVAVDVIDLINLQLPELTIEHIGSTAVPQLASNGIVDLLVIVPARQTQAVNSVLANLGFQPVTNLMLVAQNHSILVGSYEYLGSVYDIHVHILGENDPAIYQMRGFRDRLRYDLTLQTNYVDQKRAMAKSGKAAPSEYIKAKADFIRKALNQ